jgi:signal transduction histidine kinase
VSLSQSRFVAISCSLWTRLPGSSPTCWTTREKYARGADDRTIRLAALHCGDTVEVSVEDRGPGIRDKTKLFRAFSRGVSSSDGPPGLGLGLALSMSLARATGGELTYKPRDGGGATFVLQLPRM